MTQLKRAETFSLVPRDFAEALEFARLMASSDMVPKDYRGKPANIIVAVQMGADLGLSPVQAIQNIAVINGRPCLWGDAVLAIVQSHRDCRGVTEIYHVNTQTAVCVIRRQGRPEVERSFSRLDAETAGLWGKPGPWTQYPKRMLQMRARSFACRDAFPDALRGISTAEEMSDVVATHKTGAVVDAEPMIAVQPVQQPVVSTESETTHEEVDQAEVASLLEGIHAAETREDISALRDRIVALPKGSPERQRVIDAGVQRTMDIEAAAHAEQTQSDAIETD